MPMPLTICREAMAEDQEETNVIESRAADLKGRMKVLNRCVVAVAVDRMLY